jgi:hypothetical protein
LVDSDKRNFNASVTFRAPVFNKNISLVASIFMSTLFKNLQVSDNGDKITAKEYSLCGKLGIDFWGDSGRSIFPYVQADNGSPDDSMEFSGGIDFSL